MQKKFNPTNFRAAMTAKIHEKGYHSVNDFVAKNKDKFHRNALMRALTGVAVPSLNSLNSWCKALECTPDESAEIIASITIDEDEEESVAA